MSKKILIIDDSALMRRVISDIINESNDYEATAIARDGVEGFDLIVSNPYLYSAIILDINMPKMNGIELLRELQKNNLEQTVIVVSTVAKQGAKETIQALEYGAFDFVTKPENYLETKSEEFKKKIHETLDVATSTRSSIERIKRGSASDSVKVDRTARSTVDRVSTPPFSKLQDRIKNNASKDAPASVKKEDRRVGTVPTKFDANSYTGINRGKNKLVALACSTGGPKSLQQVIPLLPKNLDAGMVVVQHMPKGFTLSLAQRLNEMSELEVREAKDGDIIKKGTVLIAPGGKHIRIQKHDAYYIIKLSEEEPIEGLRPCANTMYDSLVNSSFDEITCVVLTGMGADGTKGIKELSAHKKKIHVIAQNEDTCVVYGMPKAIALTGLVNEVVPLEKVAETITKNVGVS